MEIETKEKPPILHFQVKNIGFCQQSESSYMSFFYKSARISCKLSSIVSFNVSKELLNLS